MRKDPWRDISWIPAPPGPHRCMDFDGSMPFLSIAKRRSAAGNMRNHAKKIPERPSECAHMERFGGEFGWVIYWDLINEHAMQFFLLEIACVTKGETKPEFYGCESEATTDPDEGVRFVHGSIKWDGCADFDMGDARIESYRHHICSGKSGMARMGAMLASVVDLAERVIPAWAP